MFDLELLGLLSLIAVLLTILVRSADLIEDAFVFLAKKLGVSEFIIGFFILSAVSSLPEFSIAISSNNVQPQLSIGNLFGATVVLLTLIVGLTAIKFGPLDFKEKFGRNEVAAALFFVALGGVSFLDGYLSVFDGIFMVLAFLLFLLFVMSRSGALKAIEQHAKEKEHKKKLVDVEKLLEMLGKAVLGIILILVSSSLLVDTVIELSKPEQLNINSTLVGIFILAIGTNIPELTFLLRAKKPKQESLALGNFIGSAVMNTFIIGLLGILSQGVMMTSDEMMTLTPVLTIFAAAVVLFLIFSWTGSKITKREAYFLLALYGCLILTEGVFLFI